MSSTLLLSVLLIASILIALPAASAHDPPWTVPTTAFCSSVPSTVGVNQPVTIVVWLDRISPTGNGLEGQRWNGFKIDITKPDGSIDTIGPFQCSSTVASDFKAYTPTQIGTYSIVFSWPGEEVKNGTGIPEPRGIVALGDFYEGATSKPAKLIVQQNPIQGWIEPPVATGYWERPLNAANREWTQLASNWLKGAWLVNNWQRWGKAPETPHVLWANPITPARAGGINDAQWYAIPSDVNDYESPWSSPIIMNGKIYYNTPSVADSANYGYYCVDLCTGEQVWYKNGTDNGLNNPVTTSALPALSQSYPQLSMGQLLRYYSVNGQGVLAYLWMQRGTTWYMLDASTGNLMLTLKNVPSGSAVVDQDGNLLLYSYIPNTGQVLCWNSSQAIYPGGVYGTNQQQWKPRMGGVIDAVNDTSWAPGTWSRSIGIPDELLGPHSGYTMNVTGPKNLPSSAAFGGASSGISAVLQDANRVPKMIFGFYKGAGSTIGSPLDRDTFSVWTLRIDEHVAPYSPLPQADFTQNNNLGFGVTLLLNKEITVPIPGKNHTWNLMGVSYDDQVFTLRCSQTLQVWGYSLETGDMLWGPIEGLNAMDFYGVSANMYYGKVLVVSQYGGTMAAYDAKTGVHLWTYEAVGVGSESYYGDNMPLTISAVADGKVYLHSSEHSPTKPLWRASYLRCVDINTGKELWKLLDFNMGLSIADGYIVTGNQYDNLVYCIGKGPSATTVEATPGLGNVLTIKGTVTDQSPGAQKIAQKFGFTDGVPAISDADQQAWMEYLYEQQARPTNAKGVTVHLTAIDHNGNSQEIGYVTSDIGGSFGIAWTPPIEGTYQVTATFDGTKSYGASYATTYFSVGQAAAASPSPTSVPQPPGEAGPTTTYIAIAATLIIAIVAAVALFLRSRK